MSEILVGQSILDSNSLYERIAKSILNGGQDPRDILKEEMPVGKLDVIVPLFDHSFAISGCKLRLKAACVNKEPSGAEVIN